MNLLKKLLVPAIIIANVINGYAQSIELTLSPTTQIVEIGQTANVTIKAKGIDGFNGQIFLKISSSGMPNSKNELSSDLILPPYTETSTLSITPFAGTEEKTYSFTIDAYNGTLSISKSIVLNLKSAACSFSRATRNFSFIDNNGIYWVGPYSNILKSLNKSTEYALPNYEYRSRFIDRENNFWFATNKGIVKFDGKSASVLNSGTNNLPITDIYFLVVDSNNAVWIADKNKLYKQTLLKWEEIDLKLPIEQEIVDLVLDFGNNIWVASNNYPSFTSVLQKVSNNVITTFSHTNSCLPKSKMHKITIDKSNALWIGLYNENTNNSPSKQNSILKIDGEIWEFWCNENAIPNHFIMDNTCKVLVSDQSSGYVGDYGSPVYIDGNDNKWISAIGNGGVGLGLIKFSNQVWKTYNSSNSEISGFVGSIFATLNSKKVFINDAFVYEDCEKPLATDANIAMVTNTITISQTANNQFQIQSQQNIDALVLMNMNGTELRNEIAKTNNVQVDYSGFASGLYLLKVISNNQVSTKKLRIE